MKKSKSLLVTCTICICLLMSSCYSHKNIVGSGAYKDIETTKWNHYVLFGLIPVKVHDTKDMAEGAIDYTIYTRQTVPNWILTFVTFGIWAPTTTTVSQ